MTITARVFMSGHKQALRLRPIRRLQTRTVQVEQIGNDLWLHREAAPDQDMGPWLQQFYANNEVLPADFLNERTAAEQSVIKSP